MKSIFKKQFLVQTSIIIISLLILGSWVTNISVKFFINQKKLVLVKQGEELSKLIKRLYYIGGYYDKKSLSDQVNILDEYFDTSFIYVNENNEITIISSQIDDIWLGKILDIRGLEGKNNKDRSFFSFTGNMAGIFNEEVLTIGYYVYVSDIKVGTIFMSTPTTYIRDATNQMYHQIILVGLISTAISFVLIYIFSRKITLPLIEINKTAKIIASGDLQKRIKVKSNDEIGQLADSFNEMAESLADQEQIRREFISNISHDIRSPLTSIKGFLQAILDKTIPDESKDKYIKIVLEEVERLTNLSNNILEINKMNFNNELNYTEFDINEIIRLSIINLETRIISKEINVNVNFYEESTFVKADIDKIKRVLYNLIDNAIKFTYNKGQIYIETHLAENKVLVSVKDTGCGIAKENQKNIFNRFYKEDTSRGENKNGSGLGLSIVKEFILAHNQRIAVKSEKGKGSEFVFTLDLA